MNTFDDILGIMAERRSQDSALIRAMIRVREKYNGDQAVLLPDVKGEPSMVAPIAQIVTDAVDFLANRASGSRPAISVPAVDPSSDKSLDRAARRRRAFYATWYENGFTEVILRRAYRHYFGYGTFAAMAMPDATKGVRVELRDPLTTYPEMRTPDDIHQPLNVGFVYGRSTSWLRSRYPEIKEQLKNSSNDRLWDLVEWVDEDDVVLGVLGPRYDSYQQNRYSADNLRTFDTHAELRRWPNRAGMVPCAIPRRVTLDRVMGQVWAAVGQQDHLERFTALEISAAEKYVYPDMVVLGRDGRTPMLVSGSWKDGRTGEANFIQDGDVKMLNAAPGVLTMPTIDRIERAARVSSGLIPQAGGEQAGSLRTGRAIDAMAGFSTDPRIQEAQEVTARHLATLNEGICAVYKGNFPNRKFTFFSGWPGDGGEVSFTPGEDFETSSNVVSYAFPGSDVTEISVAVGQLVSLRMMSRQTGMTKHPWIEDPEHEKTRIVVEQMEDAALQSILEQSVGQVLPLIDLARIIDLYRGGMTLTDSILQASEEAQQRQAAMAPPPGPDQIMAPQQAPGLALPGQGVETLDQTMPTQGPPPQGTQNAAQLFRALQAGT